MPTYEYYCPDCRNHSTRRDVPVAARDGQYCICGADRPMQRRLEAPAIAFRGSGFYVTDYKRKHP